MSTAFLHSRKTLYVAIGILAIAGGGWAVARMAKNKAPSVPKDLTVEALQKVAAADPGKAFEKVHEVMHNSNLTEEQRHQVMENAHAVMEAQMDKRLDEYFTAPENQRVAILDRQIDEMQARMKDWEKRRAEHEKERAARNASGGPSGGGATAAGGGNPGGPTAGSGGPGPGGDRRWGGPRGEPTRQQRKERFESRNPDSMARRMAYFTAMRKRAQERGIQMPGFMGRGPGGPGGGRP